MKKIDHSQIDHFQIDHSHQLMILAETFESKNFQQIFQFLFETEVAPLNVVNKSKNQISSSNLKEFHIIEKKRTRRFNSKYAIQHVFIFDTFISEKNSKIFAFHAAFLIGINRISKISVHAKNLFFPPTNWRAMERHRHAEKFRRAANVEYSALKARDT